MSTVVINYDALELVAKNANSASSQMQNYIDKLNRKVLNKYSDIKGGASSRTNSSEYYVNKKIAALRKKKTSYTTFAFNIKKFSEKAYSTDHAVSVMIKNSQDKFINQHEYIKTGLSTVIRNWFIDLKNSCPVFQAIGDILNTIHNELSGLYANLKHLYKCGGGKELANISLAVAGAVFAVVILIATIVTGGTFLAIIGAALAAINAVVNMKNSFKAFKAQKNGDPAWAKIYDGRDSLQDDLRQTNFGNKDANRMSGILATGLDFLQVAASLGSLGKNLKSMNKTVQTIKSQTAPGQFMKGLKAYAFNTKAADGIGMRNYIDNLVKERSIVDNFKAGKATVDFVQNINDMVSGKNSITKGVWNGIKDNYHITKVIDSGQTLLKDNIDYYKGIKWSYDLNKPYTY